MPRMEHVEEISTAWKKTAGKLWGLFEDAGKTDSDASESSYIGQRFSDECELLRRFWSKVYGLTEFATRFACADAQLVALLGPAGAGRVTCSPIWFKMLRALANLRSWFWESISCQRRSRGVSSQSGLAGVRISPICSRRFIMRRKSPDVPHCFALMPSTKAASASSGGVTYKRSQLDLQIIRTFDWSLVVGMTSPA